MLNTSITNEAYAAKNPIRATISNAGRTIYHASEATIEYAKTAKKLGQLANNALDQLLVEQQIELEQTRLQASQVTSKLSEL